MHNLYTNLVPKGVWKNPREAVRFKSDSVDGVCLSSPVFGVLIPVKLSGFTKLAQ